MGKYPLINILNAPTLNKIRSRIKINKNDNKAFNLFLALNLESCLISVSVTTYICHSITEKAIFLNDYL